MASLARPALLLLIGSLLLASSSASSHLRKPMSPLLDDGDGSVGPRKRRPELSLSLGDVVYGGSGCAEGSATLTTAGPLYTMQFHNYTAVVADGPRRVRKTCNVIIPVQAPPGVRIAVPGISIGGKANLPDVSNAYGEARAEYFMAGSSGPVVEREFQPGFDDTFGAEADKWVLTECGGSTNFRISSSIQARNAKATAVSMEAISFKFIEVECPSTSP